MSSPAEIASEYASSLSDLTFNSKPLITMLTQLAGGEYLDHASVIVATIEQHLLKVRADVKLPVLYLIDSIVKNVGFKYTQLFKTNIASLFCGVFEKVDEKIRANMFKLRSTWTGVFPEDSLYQLDVGVNKIDVAWPIVAKPVVPAVAPVTIDNSIKETILKKQKELLELQHKKLELELLQTRAKMEEQQRQLEKQNSQIKQDTVKTLLPQLKGDVVKLLSSSNPNPEDAKKLKTKFAQLSAFAAQNNLATAASESGDSVRVSGSTSLSSGKSGRSSSSSNSSKSKSSRSSGSSGGGGSGSTSTQQPVIKTNPTPFVNPFVKHNPPSSASSSDLVPLPPAQRVSINPVSSDLVAAVRRTAAATPAVRDPRLRRAEAAADPSVTTFTVTIGEPVVDKRKKSSSDIVLANEDLFGSDRDSHRKNRTVLPPAPKSPSSSSSKSSSRDRRDEKAGRDEKTEKKYLEKKELDRKESRDPRSKKSSVKHLYETLIDEIKSIRDKESDSPRTVLTSRKPSDGDRKSNNDNNSLNKSKSEDPRTNRIKSSDSSEKSSRKEKEKLPDKPPLLKPSQLPPIPRLKKVSTENQNKVVNVDVKHSKTKETEEKPTASDKHTNSKISSQKSVTNVEDELKETIRLKQKQIEDELKANAKNLLELNERNNKKEKYRFNDESEKEESENSSFESKTTVDDIIRMKKPDSVNNETDVDNIIRMRKSDKLKDTDRTIRRKSVDENKTKDTNMQLETIKERSTSHRFDANFDNLKENYMAVSAGDNERNDENVPHPNKGDVREEVKTPEPPAPPTIVEEETSPVRPRLFIKNIALLTKPATPPSQDLEEISDGELEDPSQPNKKTTIPTVSMLLDDETDEESICDDNDSLSSPTEGKFKELKASSLKRLRQYVRSRDQRTPSPPPPPSSKEMTAPRSGVEQNDLGPLPTGDVDLRPYLMTNSTEEPPIKKSKPDGSLDPFGFGTQDVDLRNPLRPKVPTPPPPPVISTDGLPSTPSGTEESAGGKVEKRKIRVKPYSQLEKNFDISPNDMSKNSYDTDMRHLSTPSRNVKAIVKQAEIDLKRGSISFADYSNILKQLSTQNSEPSTPKTSESSDHPLISLPTLLSDVVPPPPLPPMNLLDDDSPLPSSSPSLPPNSVHSLSSEQSTQGPPISTMGPMLLPQHPTMLPHPMLPQMPPLLPFPGPPMVRPGGVPPFGMPTVPGMPGPPVMPGMPPLNTPGLPFMSRHPVSGGPPGGPVFASFGRLAPADPEVLASIMRDQMKSINIDNIPRPIRFYGHTGIVFLSWDDPREIGFVKGVRKITFDGAETVLCQLNAPYKDFFIDGAKHRIRLGNPTRELYIDDDFHECCFGGPPLGVIIGGKKHLVTLDGPPPTVTIDTKKRVDLCAGKVDLYIDDKIHVPMFLDCKPHKVDVDGFPYILRFVEALRVLVINGSPFNINFGGPAVTIPLHDKPHTFAFTPLPPGVRQGYVTIAHMDGGRLPSPPPLEFPSAAVKRRAAQAVISAPPMLEEDSQDSQNVVGLGNNEAGIPFLNSGEEINVNDLFAKLVALGALPASKPAEDEQTLKNISWHSDRMKERQPAMIHSLYSGIQCGSCGARFPPDQTTKYSLHLDWHFRINRRERDLGRSVQSRKFYYSDREWCSYYEIEDDENKGQSWFEMQECVVGVDGRAGTGIDDEASIGEVATCTAELNEVEPRCGVCRDRFEQFYNEDKEEWQLRRAVRVKGVAYHPVCYQDQMATLEAKQNEPVPNPEDEFIDNEEGPVPEDAEEFTRTIPVGIYTIADDIEDDNGDCSVQVIDQQYFNDDEPNLKTEPKPSDLKTEPIPSDLKTETEPSDLINTELSNVKLELLGDNLPPPPSILNEETLVKFEDIGLSNVEDKMGVSNVKMEMIEETNHEEAMHTDELEEGVTETNMTEQPSEENTLDQEMSEPSEKQTPLTETEQDSEPNNPNEEKTRDVDNELIKEENQTMETETNEESILEESKLDKTSDSVDEKINTPDGNTSVAMATTDLEGNVAVKTTVPNTMPATTRIKINITKTVLPGNIVKPIEPIVTTVDESSLSPKQIEVVNEDSKDKIIIKEEQNNVQNGENNTTVPLDQPKSVKPLIASKNMTHYPPLRKGKDLSALCSIM